MSDAFIIRKRLIDDALERKYRLYFTGKLQMPQDELECIDDDIEIGMSHYKEFTSDTPHLHPVATEHAYVLEGCMRIKLLDGSEAEYEIRAGDFFVLRPKIPYASKNQAGTKVLFVKSPGGNDKVVVDIDKETKQWLSSWDIQDPF